MVFGSPRAAVRRSFEEVAVVDGVWLGRRPMSDALRLVALNAGFAARRRGGARRPRGSRARRGWLPDARRARAR